MKRPDTLFEIVHKPKKIDLKNWIGKKAIIAEK